MAQLDQFPMFRFATLLARQLSSPIANRLKIYARDHPLFGRAVCARVGRFYRVAELRFKMWSLQLAGPRTPVSISDREAIDVGTDLLGEMIIFGLGALIIIFEVNRQAMKQEVKKMDKRSQWMAIKVSLEELKVELEIQQKEIDLLLAAIRSLDPDVPLPSSLAKPLPHDPAAEPTTPGPPSSSLMKPLPQPVTDPSQPKPPGPPNLSSSSPSQLTITNPKSPSSSHDQSVSKYPNALPVPDSSSPDAPHPAPLVIHPPGCTCVPPPSPPPLTPHSLPKPPPPLKPHCPPKPPPTACG